MNARRSMLHRVVRAMVAFALTGLPAAAYAQSKVYVGIGAAIPIGGTADQLSPGYNAIVSLSAQPSWLRRNSLRLEVGVNSLPERAVPDARRQLVSETVNVVLSGDQRPAPVGFVILGAGMYQQSASGARRSDPGFNVGAGIRFSMGFFGTFVEARLHYINDDERTKYFPMTFGLTF